MQLAPQPAAAPAGEHTLDSLIDQLRTVLSQSLDVHRELLA